MDSEKETRKEKFEAKSQVKNWMNGSQMKKEKKRKKNEWTSNELGWHFMWWTIQATPHGF